MVDGFESLSLLFDNVQVFFRVVGTAAVKHDAHRRASVAATLATAAAATRLAALQRRAVRGDKMFAEIPLVLDHLLADGAGHAL